MITASFIINIVLGVLNVFAAGVEGKNEAGAFLRLLTFTLGAGLITFGLIGLVYVNG